MRILPIFMLVLLSSTPGTALAQDFKLFEVEKSEIGNELSRESLTQVFISANSCKLGELDYYWCETPRKAKRAMLEQDKRLCSNGLLYKPMDSRLKVGARKKFNFTKEQNIEHTVKCSPESISAGTCQIKFVKAEDINLVAKDLANPYLVIRAIKAKDGACKIYSYMDVAKKGEPAKVVQVSRIFAEGSVIDKDISFTTMSATATVSVAKVVVYGVNGAPASDPWTCKGTCTTSVTVSAIAGR